MARGAAALVANTVINAALGLAFWVLAARVYPDDVVGLASAAISALLLAAGFGWTGVQYLLIRYLPAAGRAGLRLVFGSYGAAILIGAVAALLVSRTLDPERLGVADPAFTVLFVVSAAVWVVFSLQDAAFIGLRRPSLVPIGNGVFGMLKLAWIAALAASVATPFGIFIAWFASAAVVLVGMHVFGLVPMLWHASVPSRLPSGRRLARFAAGQHVGALLAAVPDWTVPLLVVSLVGEAQNAWYYAAWTIGFAFRLIAVNLANVYTVQASDGGHARQSSGRELRRLAPIAIIPLVVLATLGAEPLLAIFGETYQEGAIVLRWFGVGLIPFSIVTFYLARERVAGRSGPAVLLAALTTGMTLAVDVWLLPRAGVAAAGFGWAAAWLAACLVVLGWLVVGPRRRSLPPGNDNQTGP